MALRTPLGRVRGLGAAKEGVEHWWMVRLTSIALVPLTIWFVASIVALAGADYAEVIAWLRSPVVAVTMVLLIGITFHHTQAGLQVVIEDYVHDEAAKLAAIIVVKAAALVLGLAGIFAVLKIAFGGL
jgi:succinate dehydrogenase / fumarate reductase, membrane anchor subunit